MAGGMERWIDVTWLDGYRGVLEVSDAGRIRRRGYSYEVSNNRWGGTHKTNKPDKLLSHYVEKNGYPTVAVQINGRRKKFSLHYLVARAFVPGYAPGLCVNHIDGNKVNNNAANLEWVTLAQNTRHAWETGLVDVRGDKSPARKLHSGQVRIIRRLLKMGATCGQLATLCNVDTSTIVLIKKGKRWQALK